MQIVCAPIIDHKHESRLFGNDVCKIGNQSNRQWRPFTENSTEKPVLHTIHSLENLSELLDASSVYL